MRIYYIVLLGLGRVPCVKVSHARLGWICDKLAQRLGGIWVSKARYHFIMAFRKGESMGFNNLASCYATGTLGFEKDLRRAVELYKMAVDRGCVGAMYNLGRCYYDGEGVVADKDEAAILFDRASKGRFTHAHYWLGMMYLRGEGVRCDKRKAVKLFRRAAWSGMANAQYDLAVCYRDGDDGRPRPYHAAFWIMMAALNGCRMAKHIVGRGELADFLEYHEEGRNA